MKELTGLTLAEPAGSAGWRRARRSQPGPEGFTLVELAIVIIIIGLLIGGVLKGQQILQNARVTAEVAQVKSISAAMTAFQDMYNAKPGDMPNAGLRLPGCPGASGASCTPAVGSIGQGAAGDGFIGPRTWEAQSYGGIT